MIATKKVFFGSLFEFTSTGAEEVLDGFRGQYVDAEEAPFISFNDRTQLFSCDVDQDDYNLIPLLNAQIGTYITLHGIRPNELFELERLKSIDGTTFRDQTRPTKPRDLEPNPLFDLDDSSDEEQKAQLAADSTVYWKPKCGDISILNTDIAAEIADLTGTFLIPDTVGQRVKLTHGNVQLAREKLERLDDVLTFAAPHRSRVTSCANANLLHLQTGPGSTIKFVRPAQPHCGFDRITVYPEQLPLLRQTVLAEVRLWKGTQRIKPLNLDLEGVSSTDSYDFSGIFNEAKLPVIGDPKSAIPRPPSKDNSQASGELQRPNSPTKFLGQRETQRVEEWRENVDPEAAPTLPPAAPAPEAQAKKGRRELLKDSDDEDEDEDETTKNTTTESETKILPASNVSSPQYTESGSMKGKTRPKLEVGELQKQSKPVEPILHLSSDQKPKNLAMSMVKDVQSPKGKKRFESGNMFDLIRDTSVSESKELHSEQPLSPNKANVVGKQLNVTFQEPEAWQNLSAGTIKTASPHKPDVSTGHHLDTPGRAVKKPASVNLQEANHQFQSRTQQSSGDVQSSPISTRPKVIAEHGKSPMRSQQHEAQSLGHRNWHRGSGAFHANRNKLIDIADESSLGEPQVPPPGFDYRQNGLADPSDPAFAASWDTSNPVLPPPANVHDKGSSSSPDAHSPSHHSDANFTPQYTIPKRNMAFMKDQAAARLRAQMEASNENDSTNHIGTRKMPPNRIKKDDEYSSRKYHKTMSQKTAKPGKGKNNKKTETKAEREARVAKAKVEAYGDTASAKDGPSTKPVPCGQHSNVSNDMSARKRQIIKKNNIMAELHQDVLTDVSNEYVADKLLAELRPILECARAFKGAIKVEIQLGQALVLKSNRLDEGRLYTPKDWTNLLNGKSQTDTMVTFTNILTRNGHDVDRMFEIKADNSPSKLWHKTSPGLLSTEFEFSCQDKTGYDFMLVLDQDGSHDLRKQTSTIGQIAIHSPSQIWDACAVVSGTMKVLRPSEDILVGVEQFKGSIYISGGRKAAIYYRLPPNNAFTIRSIVMRRTSIYDCLSVHLEAIQLRVTEVKALAHSAHPTDKKLFRSYESSYEVMVSEGRIHYEVAIINKDVEAAFKSNPTIEIGEIAPVDSADGKVINGLQARGLVDVTAYMLERIDWVGASNIGTLRRLFDNAADARATIVNTLPGDLKHNLPIPMGINAPPTTILPMHQSQQSRLGAGTTTIGPEPTMRQLHGVRTNTIAELYQDRSTGEFFYYGLGGARVPVVSEQLEATVGETSGPVLPDDSASQVGDARRRFAAGKKIGAWDDKPAGFW